MTSNDADADSHEEKKVDSSNSAFGSAATGTGDDAAKEEAAPPNGDEREGKAALGDAAEDGAPPQKDPMDEEFSHEDRAGFVSKWLLLYLSPVLKLGSSKVLDAADIGPPSKCDRAGACYDPVAALWIVEVARAREANGRGRLAHQGRIDALPADASKKRRDKIGAFKPESPDLAKVLWRAFGGGRIWWAVFLYVISALFQFLPVLILNDLVRYFESSDPDNFTALLFHPWGDVVGLFVFPLVVSLLQTRSQVILNHCAIFIRTSVSTLLFSKALTISAAGRAQTSTGQVVNMVRSILTCHTSIGCDPVVVLCSGL